MAIFTMSILCSQFVICSVTRELLEPILATSGESRVHHSFPVHHRLTHSLLKYQLVDLRSADSSHSGHSYANSVQHTFKWLYTSFYNLFKTLDKHQSVRQNWPIYCDKKKSTQLPQQIKKMWFQKSSVLMNCNCRAKV